MKVCWLSSLTSPYKMKTYEIMGKEIELVAIVDNGRQYKRYAGWDTYTPENFKIIFIDDNWKTTLKKEIKDCDIFVDSLYSTKYGITGLFYSKLFRKISVLHADGGIAKDHGFVTNAVVTTFMMLHNYLLGSGPITANYFNYFTKGKKQILNYNFASITLDTVINNNNHSLMKEAYKKDLGLNKFTFLSVGRPVYRKGYDILLKAFNESGLDGKAQVLIVGGDPTEDNLTLVKELGLENVAFEGMKTQEELIKYYSASDCFVLCTREDVWGLVINEAISFNLPIITSDNCMAGLHFNQVHNIGTIVKNEDVSGYAKALINAFNKKETPNYLEVSKLYTIEETAAGFLKALNDIKKIK